MVITDFKLRYQGSVLGYIWSLLRPLFLFLILYVVFVRFLKIGGDIPHYPVYLLIGIVVWNFFTEITNSGVTAIVGQSELIRKLNFPKYVIILASAVSALINLVLNVLVIGLFMYISGVDISRGIVLVPLLLLEVFVFGLAVSFILGALYVRLRDINYIWEVIAQALFYATPIIYPVSKVSEQWPEGAKLILLNPVAQAVQDIRYVSVTPRAETIWHISGLQWYAFIPPVLVVLTTIFAVWFFKRRSPKFAEEV